MLTLPLLLAASALGLAGGVHCIGMCGGLANLLTRRVTQEHERRVVPILTERTAALPIPMRTLILLHGGRLSAYVLIGAVMGGIGHVSTLVLPVQFLRMLWYALGNLALVLAGLYLVSGQVLLPDAVHALSRVLDRLFAWVRASNRPGASTFLLGASWGFLPCGLLYGVLPYAWLSGHAWSGSVLALVFGLCALPHLLLAQGVLAWRRSPAWGQTGRVLRLLAGCALILLAGYGFWHINGQHELPWLCLTPPA